MVERDTAKQEVAATKTVGEVNEEKKNSPTLLFTPLTEADPTIPIRYVVC